MSNGLYWSFDPLTSLGGMTVGYGNGGPWVNVDKRGNVIGANPGGGGPLIDIIPADRDVRPERAARRIGDEAVKIGGDLLDKGRDAILGALKSNPVTAPFAIGADALGLGGDGCGWICQFQKWISESGFFQRIAIALLALIFIGVALTLLGKGAVIQEVAGSAGKALKGKG